MKGNPAPIGRDSELDALALAMAKNRVVSLTGAPGVGKSALAAAFAARHRSVYCHLHGASAFPMSRPLRRTAHASVVPSQAAGRS